MTIKELLHEVADTLRKDEGTAALTVVEEDKGDAAAELNLAIGKTRMALLVGWTAFTPVRQGKAGEAIYGDVTIAVSIFERPTVNRPNGGMRIHDVAIAVARALTGAITDDMACPLFLRAIRPADIVDELNTVGMNVEFSTKVEI